MKITKDLVEAVEAAKCFSCGAMVYEPCLRAPVDCARKFFGGTTEPMPDWEYTGKPAGWSMSDED